MKRPPNEGQAQYSSPRSQGVGKVMDALRYLLVRKFKRYWVTSATTAELLQLAEEVQVLV